jgi:hypothetical protein
VRLVTLRGTPVEESATLPDGRAAVVRVAVADDAYLPRNEIDTVTLTLLVEGEVAAVLNTVLDVDEESEGRALAREVAQRLGSGDLEPTAGALEPFADTLR